MINENTVIHLLDASTTENVFDEGSKLWNSFTDILCSVGSYDLVTVKTLMHDHAMSLDFYQKTLPEIENQGLILIENEEREHG